MKFLVDARTVLRLGRDSIRDHTTAVLELVKNGYDAGAKTIEIDFISKGTSPSIRIADSGSGMTTHELEHNWLRIGFSRKTTERFSENKRRRTGEKGIGRISADRLGAELKLLTKPLSSKPHGLKVNWNAFDVDDKTVDAIELPEIDASDIKLPLDNGKPAKSGTELRISDLRQKWSDTDIESLYSDLSLLISPFKTLSDFKIFLSSDSWKKGRVEVASQFPAHAQLEFRGTFENGKLTYDVSQRSKTKKSDKFDREIEWAKLVQLIGESAYDEDTDIGRVDIRLLFFVGTDVLGGAGLSPSKLRSFMQQNAGIRIYRDLVRVNPYGDPKEPQGDWLGLAERRSRDPAGVSRPTYKMGPNQLVGAVFLGRDSNPGLIDSSSREGLVRGAAFYKLRKLSLGCIRLLETYRHEKHKTDSRSSPGDRAKEAVAQTSTRLSNLSAELKAIREDLPAGYSKTLSGVLDEVTAISKTVAVTEKSIDELIGQSALYRGLATIGIASAVFGHETQSSIDQFKMAAAAARAQLQKDPPGVATAKTELGKSIEYADRVAAWGAFALARIQYEKRKRRERDLKILFDELVRNINPVFESASIKLTSHCSSVRAKVFEMDLEAVLLNLLTNAYHAAQQMRRDRFVRVSLAPERRSGKQGYLIAVSDSGPGVPDEFEHKIWEPLFSTKMDRHGKQIGTGLGLTIVKAIVDEQEGTAGVDSDPGLKGARFSIWLPS